MSTEDAKRNKKPWFRNIPRTVLVLAPRILGIVYILFISLFALDVFSEDADAWSICLGFMIHMIPSAILAVLLVISWHFELVGAAAYFILALLYYVLTKGKEDLLAYISISGPLLLISVLFFLNWLLIKRRKGV